MAVLILGIAELSAAASLVCPVSAITGVTLCYAPGANQTPATCPNGTQCGYSITGVAGLSTLNGTTGWHNYPTDPNFGNPQAFLNALTTGTGLAITLNGGSLVTGDNPDVYRAPTADNGYYISTSTSSVKFDFAPGGKNISQFAVYWGSVDTWNTIQFTPVSGAPITVTGTDLLSILPSGTTLGQNDTASFVLDFKVSLYSYLWTSVTLSSSSPSFEFDNIAWQSSTATCYIKCGPSAFPPGAATPEPSSLLLFCSGVLGLAGAVKRRVRK
jgi:hypothetical protein